MAITFGRPPIKESENLLLKPKDVMEETRGLWGRYHEARVAFSAHRREGGARSISERLAPAVAVVWARLQLQTHYVEHHGGVDAVKIVEHFTRALEAHEVVMSADSVDADWAERCGAAQVELEAAQRELDALTDGQRVSDFTSS